MLTIRYISLCRNRMKPKSQRTSTRDEVINFRASSQLVRALDELALQEHRTRANLIEMVLSRATDTDRVARAIEIIVSSLYDQIDRRGADTTQTEFIRGQLHGAKWILSELLGAAFKDRILLEVRRRIKKPFPHTVSLAPDGNRYGWDSDADIDGP